MLALLCSAPRVDEYDPYAAQPGLPPRQRRASRSLSFIKSPYTGGKKRRVSKMSIGQPEGFRHEFHMGKESTANTRLDLWDSARWQQELQYHEKQARTSSGSTPSITASTASVPPSPLNPNMSKRNSITPQKRKPVPSLVPDMPAISPFTTVPPQDTPLPASPVEVPSPTEEEPSQPSKPLVPLLDPPRRGPSLSVEEGDKLYVTQTVKARWDNAMDEIEKALNQDADEV